MKVNWLMSICTRVTVIVVALALGLSYVLQRDIVLPYQDPVLGWFILAAVAGLIGFEVRSLINWLRQRAKKVV